MKSSIQKLQENIWKLLLRDIFLYLFLERGVFVIIKHVCHVTEGKLLGPYVALALPGVIFLTLVRWLWKWEDRGPSPKRLAFVWGVSVGMFFFALSVAFFYTTVQLEIFNSIDAAWIIGMEGVSSTLLGFFIPYNMTLERISARSTPNTNGARSK